MKKNFTQPAAIFVLTAMLAFCTACGSQSPQQTGDTSAALSEQTETPSDDREENSLQDSRTDVSEESAVLSEESSKTNDPYEAKEQGALPPLPDEDGTDVGEWVNNIIVYHRTAYEMFYGGEEAAKEYAETISNIKKSLGDGIKVYNIVVPTHCGVTLPQRFFDEYGISDQKNYINTILNHYSADVIGINPYDTLAHHRDEYLYFNTDHHWTGLAAYYAYKDFCKAAGVDYLILSDMIAGSIEGYYGSLTNYVDPSLVDADTVHYYTLDADTSTYQFDENGQNKQSTRLMHDYAEGVNAYGVFLGGDSPLIVCHNPDGNGKKIAVVKESYGNAFCPYIALTYGETHMIDFRYIEFDFEQYLKDNGIDEVVFVNNTMASATPPRIDELNALIK